MAFTDTVLGNDFGFDDYQRVAHSASLIDTLPDPEVHILRKLLEESLEVFYDGGSSDHFLALYGFTEATPSQAVGIKKEFGDVLWYISEIATRRGQALGDLALSAASRHSGQRLESMNIAEFDALARVHGGGFTVEHFKSSSPNLNTSIDDNPGYVLQRMLLRLVVDFCGEEAKKYFAFSNVYHEPTELIDLAPEDTLWVLSAIANNLFKSSLLEVVFANIEKIERRHKKGTILEGQDQDRS